MTNQLKPCPFCGGEAELIQDFNHPAIPAQYAWQVDCTSCWIETLYHKTPEAAAGMWNRRFGSEESPLTEAPTPSETLAAIREKFGDKFDGVE